MANKTWLFAGEDVIWFNGDKPSDAKHARTGLRKATEWHQNRPGSMMVSHEWHGRDGPRQFGVLHNPRNIPDTGLVNEHMYEVLSGGVVRAYLDMDFYRKGHASYMEELDGDQQVLDAVVRGMNKAFEALGNTDLEVSMLQACDDRKASYHVFWKAVWFRSQMHLKNFLLDTWSGWHDDPCPILQACVRHNTVGTDASPYMRTQSFRMLGQSKGAQKRTLKNTPYKKNMVAQVGGTMRNLLCQDVWGDATNIHDYPEQAFAVVSSSTGKRKRAPKKAGARAARTGSAYAELEQCKWPEPGEERITALDAPSILRVLKPTELMSRPVWLSIACAAKTVGVSFHEWHQTQSKRWSFSRGAWVEEMTHAKWKALNMRDGNTVGLPFLKACATLSGHLSADLERELIIDEAYALHVDHLPHTHVEERYLDVGMIDAAKSKCVVVCSPTGTGKSTVMKDLIARYSDKRIIMIVPGVALSWACLKECNNVPDTYFRHYRSVGFGRKRKGLGVYKHLLTTVQSIWKTEEETKNNAYDLVLIDEVQSVVSCILGATCKRHIRAQRQLRWILENCQQCVLADACCTDSVREFAVSHCPDAHFVVNKWRPTGRTFSFLPPPLYGARLQGNLKMKKLTDDVGIRFKLYQELCEGRPFFDTIAQELHDGKNVFCPINSVALGHELVQNFFTSPNLAQYVLRFTMLPDEIQQCITEFVGPDTREGRFDAKFEFIHDGSGHTGAHFSNDVINGVIPTGPNLTAAQKRKAQLASQYAWTNFQLLVCTGRVRCGLDFTQKHVDTIVAYYGLSSCVTPRDAIQAIGRPRRFRSKAPHLYMSLGSSYAGVSRFPEIGLAGIRKQIALSSHLADQLCKLFNHKGNSDAFDFGAVCPPEYREITARLCAEKMAWVTYPKAAMRYWLARAGWTEAENVRTPKRELEFSKWECGVSYRDLDNIAYIDRGIYEQRMTRLSLTREEKQECKKYRFNKLLFDFQCKPGRRHDPAEVRKLWTIYSNHPEQVYNHFNLRDEELDECMHTTWGGHFRSGYCPVEVLDGAPLRQYVMEQLQTAWGIDVFSLPIEKRFTEEELAPALKWVEDNVERLVGTFHVKWTTTFGALSGLLMRWGNYELVVETRKREKIKKKFPNGKVSEAKWLEFIRENPQYELDVDAKWTRKARQKAIKTLKAESKAKLNGKREKRKDERTFCITRPRWDLLRPESADQVQSRKKKLT